MKNCDLSYCCFFFSGTTHRVFLWEPFPENFEAIYQHNHPKIVILASVKAKIFKGSIFLCIRWFVSHSLSVNNLCTHISFYSIQLLFKLWVWILPRFMSILIIQMSSSSDKGNLSSFYTLKNKQISFHVHTIFLYLYFLVSKIMYDRFLYCTYSKSVLIFLFYFIHPIGWFVLAILQVLD